MSQKPTAFLKDEYQELVDKKLDWVHRELQGPSDVHCTVDGKKMIMLCSNNYLNLSNHPRLKEEAIKAIQTHGVGSGSVRAIAGNMDLHEEWEKTLAEFKEQEAGFVTSAGFTMNEGVIPQLAPAPEDVILSDRLNHGSIIDGVRLSKAKRAVYEHCDMVSLEKELKRIDKEMKPRRILLITDGVFSMDGDHAPLGDIYKIASEFNAMIYVDDAHGDGVLGNNKSGKGLVDHYGLQGKVEFEMGTFSKAFGTMGGSLVGSKHLVNWARNKTRSYLLSGSHPPATAAASIASLKLLMESNEPVKKLWDNIDYFKKEIVNMGYDHKITIDQSTAIMPIITGENDKTKALSEALIAEGIFALPILFPMVGRGLGRIRVMMNAGLSKEELNTSLQVFESAGKKLGIIS